MKHFLHPFYALTVLVFISVAGIPTKLYAQACSVSNITVKLNSSSASGPNCTVNVDLSWDQTNNNGNKYTNLHLWTQSAYPLLSYANPPALTNLQDALGTIVIGNPTATNPTLDATYQPAPGATMLPATGVQRVYVSGSGNSAVYRFTVTGVSLILPGACSGSVTVKGDIWSSNASSDGAVQCTTIGSSFVANDPTIGGLMICNTPRQFIVNLSTQSATALQATYIVYADEAPLGTLDASDNVVYTSGTVTIPASGSGIYTSGPLSYSNTYATANLWVRVQVTGLPYSTVGIITNSCGILPVKLASFTANRISSNAVTLKWQTASEQNNKGFEILRKDGNGNFRSVGSMSSKAAGGNSDIALDYQYTDGNDNIAETQYRLLQTDLDGKPTYSPVVLVRGQESVGMSVLASVNGSTILRFNSPGKKDISIMDISGRIIKSDRAFTANIYKVSGIGAGVYFINVKELETGKASTAKVILR